MSLTTKTTFVLVPGSFSPISFFDKLISYLQADGFQTFPVALPSINADEKRKGGPATMQDDATEISKVVRQLANEGHDIIMVMWSYGGYPGTEACRGLSKAELQKEGKIGGVVGLVYVASFIPAVGTSVYSVQREPETIKNAGDYCYLDHEEVFRYIFPDLSEADGRMYTSQLKNHSAISFRGLLSYPAWKYIQTTCVIPNNDMIITTEDQKAMVSAAEAEGASISVHMMESGHAPVISIPDKVAKIMISTVQAS